MFKEKINIKGRLNITKRKYPLMEFAKVLIDELKAEKILQSAFKFTPMRVIREAIKTQTLIANGINYEPDPKLLGLMEYRESKETIENLITYTGEKKFARAIIGRTLTMKALAITDNTTTPTQSDTVDDFCDTAVDIYAEAALIGEPYTREKTIVYDFFPGNALANFTWEKVGMVDKYNNLITTTLYNTTKTSTETIFINYEIDL